MIEINQSDRIKLEELGVLKPVRGRYEHMKICSIHKNSKGKSIWVNDYLIIYINPDIYRQKMKKYLSEGKIDNIIKETLGYLKTLNNL
jgi:hypothetical protein